METMGFHTDLFPSYVTFARPSPSLGQDQLPAGHHEFETPSSGLLFHSSAIAVQKEDG